MFYSMNTTEQAYLHAWNFVFRGLPKPFWKLIKNEESIEHLWKKSTVEKLVRKEIKPLYIKRFLELRNKIDPFAEYQKVTKQGIKILTIKDKLYPPLLKNLYLPPIVLYIKGTFPHTSSLFVSIVGTRNMTDYGEQNTHTIVRYLQRYNAVIVSGLANGIDTVAHSAALQNKMLTVAVLGFGFDYLPYHKRIFTDNIMEHGALISEYPPHVSAEKFHFPLRNRIISGLSQATVVVEAGERSGALITAESALEQIREVFAIPGDITREKSAGTNRLIQKLEAHLLTHPREIIEILEIEQKSPIKATLLNKDDEIILNQLKKAPLNQGELFDVCGIKPADFQRVITQLELSGYIKKNSQGKYMNMLS